jgi:hypothetical protein
MAKVPGTPEWLAAHGHPVKRQPTKLVVTGPPCPCGEPFRAGQSHACDLGAPKVLPHDQVVLDNKKAAARRLLGIKEA